MYRIINLNKNYQSRTIYFVKIIKMEKNTIKRIALLSLHLFCIIGLLGIKLSQSDPIWDKTFSALLVFVSLNFIKVFHSTY
jgi:hypothetical protein